MYIIYAPPDENAPLSLPTTSMPFIEKFRRNPFPLENQLERTLKDVTKNP